MNSPPLKIKITSHQMCEEGKISYVVEVRNPHSMKVTRLRYSEFRSIHDQLQHLVSKLKLHIQLPTFPSRKLVGSTNKSQQAIYERKKELTLYLQSLLAIEKLHLLDVVKKHFVPEAEPNTRTQDINMQICIDRYTLVEDVVIYYVRLRDLDSHQEWTFKTRYSELRNLHQALETAKIKNLYTIMYVDPYSPRRRSLASPMIAPKTSRREEKNYKGISMRYLHVRKYYKAKPSSTSLRNQRNQQ